MRYHLQHTALTKLSIAVCSYVTTVSNELAVCACVVLFTILCTGAVYIRYNIQRARHCAHFCVDLSYAVLTARTTIIQLVYRSEL
jgi:hypothetical protein